MMEQGISTESPFAAIWDAGLNGFAPSQPEMPPPVPLISVEEVERRVAKARRDMEDLRTRMEGDYARFRLEWTDARWADASAPVGQSKYVSNEPWTFGNRMISILSTAKLMVRVPYGANVEANRSYGEAKEQFVLGCLRLADRRLVETLMPKLQGALSHFICLRGWYAGRALLIKGADGKTMIDVSPFDPMHTYYGLGRDGLRWVCHVTRRTREDIEGEYDTELPVRAAGMATDQVGIDVLDYYDRDINCVVGHGVFLKEPSPHFAGRVPCFVGAVGSAPFITRKDDEGSLSDLAAQGESIYAGSRGGIDAFNQTMSDRMTLVRRSLRPGYVFKSVDGRGKLDSDPFEEGAGHGIRVNEEIKPLELLGMAKDTDILLAQVSGELQRAGLPHTVYGELGQTLSGYAITTLNQGHELTVGPYVDALENAYFQVAYLLCSQYSTGYYEPIIAQGSVDKEPFRRLIEPMMVAEADDLEIEFTPSLPRDEPGAYQMAEIAVRNHLISRRTARDGILKIQNVDAEEGLLREERGEEMSPVAMLSLLIQTLHERGRHDLAVVYEQDLHMLNMQMLMSGGQAPVLQGGKPPAGNGGQAGPPQRPSMAPGEGGLPPARQRPEAKVDTGQGGVMDTGPGPGPGMGG